MKPAAPLDVDPLAGGFLAEPWPAYRRLHDAGPVLWHERLQWWLVPGHAAARAALRDAGLRSFELGGVVARLGARARREFPVLKGILDAIPFFSNPPAHAAMRRFVAGILTARPMSAHVPVLRALARELLAPAARAGGFDAVRDFADRMPPLFMGRLLGIADDDVPRVLEHTTGVIQVFNRVLRIPEYAVLEERAAKACAMFQALAAERRRTPADDGISRMIAARHEGRALDDDEVARSALALFLTGVETTSTLIGSSIRMLLEHPERCEELRRDRSLLPEAIEEVLRCETPVQLATRLAARDWTHEGVRIASGERILVLLGAANRDPSAYPEPDRFDPRRAGPPHLAFSDGPHVCLGATLARTETLAALDAFLDLPRLRRAAAGESWWPYDWLRRLRALPLEMA